MDELFQDTVEVPKTIDGRILVVQIAVFGLDGVVEEIVELEVKDDEVGEGLDEGWPLWLRCQIVAGEKETKGCDLPAIVDTEAVSAAIVVMTDAEMAECMEVLRLTERTVMAAVVLEAGEVVEVLADGFEHRLPLVAPKIVEGETAKVDEAGQQWQKGLHVLIGGDFHLKGPETFGMGKTRKQPTENGVWARIHRFPANASERRVLSFQRQLIGAG